MWGNAENLVGTHKAWLFKDSDKNQVYIYNEKKQRFSCRSNEFPPLFCENGYAWSAHMTGKLSPNDIIGRTVIIDSGICEGKEKIAYGEICAV